MDNLKRTIKLISIALISSFIYAVIGAILTPIINGGNINFDYSILFILPTFSGIFPFFLIGWVPLSLLNKKIISRYKIKGYVPELFLTLIVGIISFFFFGILASIGYFNFYNILEFSVTFGSSTAFIFYNTTILYNCLFNNEFNRRKKLKGLINLFVIALAFLSLNFTLTGGYGGESFEKFNNINEVEENSPIRFKLPSYLPNGLNFSEASIFQDRREVIIQISYSGNHNFFIEDSLPMLLTISDKSMKKELFNSHDNIKEISVNKNKANIGYSAQVDFDGNRYLNISLTWMEDDIYYLLSSDVYKDSIMNEDEILKVAESFSY